MKIEKCIHVHQKDLLKHKTKNYINVIQFKKIHSIQIHKDGSKNLHMKLYGKVS